ncbi:hypothetical protein TRP8649_01382 [Pelagimonas phthalicica]|uniref:Lipoprotein n=1 Tax=Pelagimonas phthalicica TaxID=1037362 RepID=A0A238J9L5_9RHOB|nr:hypothetical protein [Pelagimonas phthalicica]TDS94196.1 hypothetical protein CLV87_0690 [Pelagimonas phthalicica]SMX27279.1 hypothetical protein TRP8649_01382 [Pelagimonas phthalicica]
MQARLLLPIAALLLSGCAQGVSNALPPVKEYSPEVQARAADELEALPPNSVLAMMIADYAVLRAQVRAGR